MFDIFRLKEVLVQYKKVFVSEQWPNEKYKWEAVKCFQDNWDINAKDFADMLTRSLSKTCNLLASMNNFPAKMIQGFAKVAPEEVRAMFIALFDESNDEYLVFWISKINPLYYWRSTEMAQGSIINTKTPSVLISGSGIRISIIFSN